jgi:hypothetical protein
MKKPILHLTRARHCVESLSRYFFVRLFLSPETAAPSPQRWGLLRKGRAVFRREDRVDRLTVAIN